MLSADKILENALEREEISAIEALILLQEKEHALPNLFHVARIQNERAHGNTVTYLSGKQIIYTNICKARCKFCSFYKDKNHNDAFTLSPREVCRKVKEEGGTKVLELQGGLNPDLSFQYLVTLLRTLREEFPSLHIHAFTPSEIYFMARKTKISPEDALKKLKEAGLNSMSGATTDVLNDRIRKKCSPDVLRTNDWIDIIKTAHRLGISTNVTLLFGHAGNEIHLCEHLEIIKTLQKETNGFTSFTPYPFVPHRTALQRDGKVKAPLTTSDIFKMHAVARLFFNKTIKNIGVAWTLTGLTNALKSLSVGANDLGLLEYDSSTLHSRENNGTLSYTPALLRHHLRKTGKILKERSTSSLSAVPFTSTPVGLSSPAASSSSPELVAALETVNR